MVFGVNGDNVDEMLSSTKGSNFSIDDRISEPISSLSSGYLDSNRGHKPDLSALSLKKIRKETAAKIEKIVIEYVLGATGWNRRKASRILDISYKSLLDKIMDLDLTPP